MASLFENLPNPRAAELRAGLAHFTGTETWYRHWTKRALYTDGARFLADTAGAHWLLDVIASWQQHQSVRAETFQHWVLRRESAWWRLACDDGNGQILASQRIKGSDFPLDTISLYCVAGGPGGLPVIMLPGEY